MDYVCIERKKAKKKKKIKKSESGEGLVLSRMTMRAGTFKMSNEEGLDETEAEVASGRGDIVTIYNGRVTGWLDAALSRTSC